MREMNKTGPTPPINEVEFNLGRRAKEVSMEINGTIEGPACTLIIIVAMDGPACTHTMIIICGVVHGIKMVMVLCSGWVLRSIRICGLSELCPFTLAFERVLILMNRAVITMTFTLRTRHGFTPLRFPLSVTEHCAMGNIHFLRGGIVKFTANAIWP